MANVPNVPGVPALSSYSESNPALLTGDALQVINAFLPPPWGIYQNGFPVLLPASIVSQALNGIIAPIATIASIAGVGGLVPATASTVEFEFRQDWTIADYPVELGSFQSYDKVQLPFEVRMRVAGSGTAYLNALFAIAGGSPLGANLFQNLQQLLSVAGLSSGAGSFSASSIFQSGSALPTFDIVTPEGTYASTSVRHMDFTRTSRNGVVLIVADIWFQQIRQTASSVVPPLNAAVSSQIGVGSLNAGATSSSTASAVSASPPF